jgi:uncharacterized membrane protein HdeD (DUF308 family)/uncharacterized membrane protein YjdF
LAPTTDRSSSTLASPSASQAAVASPGWDRRRLIYGDWNWLIRDGLDVLRLAFVTGAVVFALEGRSTAVALTAASAVLVAARVVNLPRWFDFGLIVAMTLIAYGTALSLYGGWFYYDKIVHGLSPIGYVPVLYIALVRLGVVPDPGKAITERRVAQITGIFIITLALGMAVGAGYESVEWLEDKFLGGHFVGGLWDTETDLLCDTGGSLIGAAFLTVWALRGWTSHRITVVAVPGPTETPVQAAGERLRPQPDSLPGRWARRLGALPLTAQGVIAVVAGFVLLTAPAPTLRTIELVLGVALLAYAAFELLELIRKPRPLELGGTIVVIVALATVGTLLLVWPSISRLAVLYVVGAAAVAFALAEAAALTAENRTTSERWLGGLTAVAALVVGVVMLAEPRSSLDTAIALLGLFLVILGVSRLLRAAAARRSRGATS